jgi:hypothetical protein
LTKTEMNPRQLADLKRFTEELGPEGKPVRTPAQAESMVSPATELEIMLNNGYTRIKIAENPAGPDQKWGPQFVSINDYQVSIPRAQEVIVADLILRNLFTAAQSRLEIMVQTLRTYTAMQAHEERLLGNIPVYPTKGEPFTVADSAKKGTR